MATCYSCGYRVAADALSCPKCGKVRPADRPEGSGIGGFILLAIIAFLAYGYFSGNKSKGVPHNTEVQESPDGKWEIER